MCASRFSLKLLDKVTHLGLGVNRLTSSLTQSLLQADERDSELSHNSNAFQHTNKMLQLNQQFC